MQQIEKLGQKENEKEKLGLVQVQMTQSCYFLR